MATTPPPEALMSNAQVQQLLKYAGDIAGVLDSWSESSWGKDPPAIGICREKIKEYSEKIGEILPKLAAAESAREEAWLKLFKANDDPQATLRDATDGGKYDQQLDDALQTATESITDARDGLTQAETLVTWWRRELARVEANKRRHEFWREYHLTKDEAEQFAFGCEYGGGGYSAAELQKMEERIRRINRSLPAGFKPIPSMNVQTIMYVPSSVPGQYLPLTRP
jgi:chromosome segregation ATPase